MGHSFHSEDWMSLYWRTEDPSAPSGEGTIACRHVPASPLQVFAGALQQATQSMDERNITVVSQRVQPLPHGKLLQLVVSKAEKSETTGNAAFDRAAAIARAELEEAKRRALDLSVATLASGVAESKDLVRGAASSATVGMRKSSKNIVGIMCRFAQKHEH